MGRSSAPPRDDIGRPKRRRETPSQRQRMQAHAFRRYPKAAPATVNAPGPQVHATLAIPTRTAFVPAAAAARRRSPGLCNRDRCPLTPFRTACLSIPAGATFHCGCLVAPDRPTGSDPRTRMRAGDPCRRSCMHMHAARRKDAPPASRGSSRLGRLAIWLEMQARCLEGRRQQQP